MSKWTRAEIQRRALRAAARAALLGALACGEAPATPLERAGEVTPPDAGIAATQVDAPQALADAGLAEAADAGAALAVDAGPKCAAPDGTVDAGLSEEEAWTRYQACCAAVGWDWNQGCMAWGPPVPPAMGVA